MYNVSTSLIEYKIYENDQEIYACKIPYDLLYVVRNLTEDGTGSRYSEVNIDGNLFRFGSIGYDVPQDYSSDVHEALTTNQIIAEGTTRHEAFMQLAEEQLNLEKAEHTTAELQRLAIEAFNAYEQLLLEQKQLTEEQARLNEAEKLRQDENRIALVRGVALDPSTAPAALESEFGQSGDIRRQVAAVMERDISISKRIVQLPRVLWMSSYEIMEVIGAQSSQDREFSQLVSDNLPDDSSLKILIKSFGWAN
jgi:hypothetical protein